MMTHNQFIIRKAKIPYTADGTMPGNPHDPVNWMDHDTAVLTAELFGPEYGIGFVFTADDPFWFVDIDHCRVGDAWTEIAVELCKTLKGVYCEISMSGEGLHLIGSGTVPEHTSRNSVMGIELYTQGRYVALTGNVLGEGNAYYDTSWVMPQLVEKYWQPTAANSSTMVDWTTEPVVGWAGPTDDTMLLAKMMASGAIAAFTGKVSFRDLWTANAPVLSASYPDPARPYDASSADAAMAQMLAFWTGRNCRRIERLMRLSALARDKWDRHESAPGYLQRTILKAVNRQTTVYSVGVAPEATTKEGYQYMTVDHQKEHFTGCVYISASHRIWTPGGQMLKPEQFRVKYGGYVFALDSTNNKTTKSAWEVFTESQAYHFPKVDGTCFRPSVKTGCVIHEEGRTLLNVYVPIQTVQANGNIKPFHEYMKLLLPNPRDRDILLNWMAALVQYPGVKFQWSPIIQGVEGNGKSILIRALCHAVGNRYSHLPNAKDLGGNGLKFNGWLEHKLFIGVEEIFVADKREITEALKPIISNDKVEIQSKGMDQYTGDNFANFLMCSNHKDCMHVKVDSRRYAMMYTAQQSLSDMERDGMIGDYFPKLYDWLREDGYAIINKYLRTYKIMDEYNPATQCHRAPKTTSTGESIILSRGRVEQEIEEAIDEGQKGFAGGWVSSLMMDALIERLKASIQVPRVKRRRLMQDMGYDWHPALVNSGGRINNPIHQEGGKPKLYCKIDHINFRNLQSCVEVTRAYCKAQGYIGNAELQSNTNH